MAKRQHSELTAGLFVVAALAAGVGVLLWLGATDLLARPKQRAAFFVERDSGSLGLATGNFVLVNDAPVGKISEIRFVPARGGTLYFAEIERDDVKIHSDAKAYVGFAMVGTKPLVVTSMGSEAKPLADEHHPVTISSTAFDEALKDLAAAAEKVKLQLDETEKGSLLAKILHVAALLGGEIDAERQRSLMAKAHTSADDVNAVTAALRRQTDPADPKSVLAKVGRTADSVEKVAGTIRDQTNMADDKSILAKVGASADNVKSATTDAAAMAKKIRPDIEQTVAKIREYTHKDVADLLVKLRRANTELVDTVGNLKAVSADGRELVALNRQRLEDTIFHLKVMSANLSAAAKEIRRNPWRLLKRPKEKQTETETLYDAVRAFGEGAGELRDAVARLEALSKSQARLTGAEPALKKAIGHLETSFVKFRKVEDNLFEKLAGDVKDLPEGSSPK